MNDPQKQQKFFTVKQKQYTVSFVWLLPWFQSHDLDFCKLYDIVITDSLPFV